MFFKGREMRRLWEVELFDGDRDDPDCPTRKETVIAWNEVDAIRRTGDKAASRPQALHFVTWPDPGDDANRIYRINNPTDGPVVDEPVEPSIQPATPEEEW